MGMLWAEKGKGYVMSRKNEAYHQEPVSLTVNIKVNKRKINKEETTWDFFKSYQMKKFCLLIYHNSGFHDIIVIWKLSCIGKMERPNRWKFK